jgi:hypothetical protein
VPRSWPGFPVAVTVAALACGVLVLCARSALLIAGPEAGLPLDDAWIHLRFAMNLAAGEGLSFNPGEASAGATSPLWVAALAMLQFLPGDVARNAALLSGVSYVGAAVLTSLLVFVLLSRLDDQAAPGLRRGAALAAGCAVALCGRFAWSGLSGMEVGLAACLQLLSMLVLLQGDASQGLRRPVIAAMLAGLSVLVRPEALLFLLLLLGLMVIGPRRHQGRRGWLVMAAAGMLPVLPWAIYCTALTGRPLPATFQPNLGGLGLPDAAYLTACLRQLFLDNPGAALLALAGAGGLFMAAMRCRNPRLLLPALWVISFPLAAAMVAPNLRHHGRYTMPLIPVIMALAAVGAVMLSLALVRLMGRSDGKPRNIVAALLMMVLVAGSLPVLPRWLTTYGWDVQNIQHQHVAVGRWLADNTEADCHVATHDIGAIGVFSGCRVTDLIGLVSPKLARLYVDLPDPRLRDVEIRRILGESGVTHVAIYPSWFPALAGDGALRQVHAARLMVLSSAGSRLMAVYRTPGPGPW